MNLINDVSIIILRCRAKKKLNQLEILNIKLEKRVLSRIKYLVLGFNTLYEQREKIIEAVRYCIVSSLKFNSNSSDETMYNKQDQQVYQIRQTYFTIACNL